MDRSGSHNEDVSRSPVTHRWRLWRECSLRVALLCYFLAAPSLAFAVVDWADWVNGTATPGLVNGVVGGVTVRVTSASVLPSQAGGAGDVVYWRNTPTYVSTTVPNPPVTADIVKINAAQAYTITFDAPVTDPVIAIVSLGGGLVAVSWDFGTHPIRLLSQGPGHFGAGPLSIMGNIVTGQEGHGVMQVIGTYTSITFNMKTFENWTGFTVGVPRVVSVPVPPVTTGLNIIAAGLSWDLYPTANPDGTPLPDVPVLLLFRGEDAECDNPLPLEGLISPRDNVNAIPATVTEYVDRTIPASAIRICYELQAAWKDAMAMASGPSNRASVLVAELVPKPPMGVVFLAGSN